MKEKRQNIILIGFMGSGKTTLGRKIARQLGLEFLDADEEIQKQLGLSIATIFDQHGELHFRELERTWITHFPVQFKGVISVGGGLPCYRDNIKLLRDLGFVIYLERTPKELFQRLTKAKKQRPLLAELNEEEMLDFIENKIHERQDFYQQADWTPTREEQDVRTITEKIREWLAIRE